MILTAAATLTFLCSLFPAPTVADYKLVARPTDLKVELLGFENVTFSVNLPLPLSSDFRLVINDSAYFTTAKTVIIPKLLGKVGVSVQGKQLSSRTFLEVTDCQSVENDTECPFNVSETFVRVTVIKSYVADWLVDIVGWAYFFAWSISFYPQIILNIRRKSVIGLNFDFLLLNVIGFLSYTLYNALLYFNESVQEEYELNHPRSPLPVLLNDVVFAVHALFACIFTVVQCFIFERENQRVSTTCIVLSSGLMFVGFTSGLLMTFNVIDTLHFVNSLSYIKMIVTLSKYFPQAFFNFSRRSTVGWSIGNVLLDFTGGSLDVSQMILQAWNVGDWTAFIGNPVKFGLGFVSIIFDIIFIIQHYILYPDVEVTHNDYHGIENNTSTSETAPPTDYGSSPPSEEYHTSPSQQQIIPVDVE